MKTKHHGLHIGFDHITGLMALFNNFISTVTHAVKNFSFEIHSNGKFRRFLLVHFKKKYVKGQIVDRHGECRQCGTCCNFLLACPMLNKQSLCRVYGICRPEACKIFPIDQRDIEDVKICGGKCGYWFDRYDRYDT